MAAEARDHTGSALCHQVERIAEMESRNRAPRSLELAAAAAREHDRRSVVAVLQAGGNDSHHALMPLGMEKAQRVRVAGRFGRASVELRERFFLHCRLDIAALA